MHAMHTPELLTTYATTGLAAVIRRPLCITTHKPQHPFAAFAVGVMMPRHRAGTCPSPFGVHYTHRNVAEAKLGGAVQKATK